MGQRLARVLPDGLQTEIGKLISQFYNISTSELKPLFELTIQPFYNFCMQFAQNVVMTGRASFKKIVDKALMTSFFGVINCPLTKGSFLETCSYVCSSILHFAEHSGCFEAIEKALSDVAEKIAESAITPFLKFYFKNVVKNAKKQETLLKPALVKTVGGTVAEEIVESAGILTRAKAGARSTMRVGAVVDGGVLAFTLGYAAWQYSQGCIDGSQLRRTAVTRSSAAVGSVGMSGAGVFIGTLIFPGVGSFIGGVVGGVVGDYMGSKIGEKADDKIAKCMGE